MAYVWTFCARANAVGCSYPLGALSFLLKSQHHFGGLLVMNHTQARANVNTNRAAP